MIGSKSLASARVPSSSAVCAVVGSRTTSRDRLVVPNFITDTVEAYHVIVLALVVRGEAGRSRACVFWLTYPSRNSAASARCVTTLTCHA